MLLTLSLVAALMLPQDRPPQERPPASTLSDVQVDSWRAPNAETFLLERAEISPDGRYVAYVAALANSRKLRIEALDGSLSRTADLEGANLRDIVWAGNGHVLLTLMTQSVETLDVENGLMSVIAYNIHADTYETLLRNRTSMASMGNRVATRLPTQPRVMAIVFERPAVRVHNGEIEALVSTISFDGSCRYDLYGVNLNTAAPVREVRGVQRAQAMIVDEAGEPAAVQQDGRIKLRRGAGWREIRTFQPGETVELVGMGRGDTVLVRAGDGPEARLVEIRRADGAVAGELPTDGLTDVLPLHDDQTGRLLGVAGTDERGRPAHAFFEPRLRAAWPQVVAAFPGDAVELASWTADFGQLLVYAERAEGSDYHLVNLADGSARLLGPSFPIRSAALDRTGGAAAIDIRRAAAARIHDPRRLCGDMREA